MEVNFEKRDGMRDKKMQEEEDRKKEDNLQ